MPLLIPIDASGLDPKVKTVIDAIVAPLQAWAGKVDGVNADERLNQLATGLSGLSTVQTGTVHAFAGPSTAVPSGYLLCDGSAVSRSQYAALFTAIGTTWGVGDGSNTFNVPDGRGRYFFGKATSGTWSTLGGTFGTKDHTHTISASGTHTHGAGTYATPSHDHVGAVVDGTEVLEINEGAGGIESASPFNHNHEIDAEAAMTITGSSGAGGDHSHSGATGTNNPPSFVGNWIIKT